MPASHLGNPTGKHKVLAYDSKENEIGSLQWDDEGNLDTIQVMAKHRRKGLGTRMLDAARQISQQEGITPPSHAEEFTALGEKWRSAVGLPEATKSQKHGKLNKDYGNPWKRR